MLYEVLDARRVQFGDGMQAPYPDNHKSVLKLPPRENKGKHASSMSKNTSRRIGRAHRSRDVSHVCELDHHRTAVVLTRTATATVVGEEKPASGSDVCNCLV